MRKPQKLLALGIILGGAIALSEPRAAYAGGVVQCPGAYIGCVDSCNISPNEGDNGCWFGGGEPQGCCAEYTDCGYDSDCGPSFESATCRFWPDVGGNSCGHYD